MQVCPLCNGFTKINILCPSCKSEMEDGGILENYYEPYSPYLPEEMLNQTDEVGENECIHLIYCPNCGYDHRYISKPIPMPKLI